MQRAVQRGRVPNKPLQLAAALVTAAAIGDDGSMFLWQPPRQPGAGDAVEGSRGFSPAAGRRCS
jgi:hypothetical protein